MPVARETTNPSNAQRALRSARSWPLARVRTCRLRTCRRVSNLLHSPHAPETTNGLLEASRPNAFHDRPANRPPLLRAHEQATALRCPQLACPPHRVRIDPRKPTANESVAPALCGGRPTQTGRAVHGSRLLRCDQPTDSDAPRAWQPYRPPPYRGDSDIVNTSTALCFTWNIGVGRPLRPPCLQCFRRDPPMTYPPTLVGSIAVRHAQSRIHRDVTSRLTARFCPKT